METKNKQIYLRISLVCLAILFMFSFGFNNVSAADTSTIYVNTTGNDGWDGQSQVYNGTSGPKATIKNATGTVATNGRIYIAQGTYNESGITINTPMTITGENQQNTIINGNNANTIFYIAKGTTVTIHNLTLINGLSEEGGAIFNNGSCTVVNTTFANNTATFVEGGGAIFNNEGSISSVSGCTFTGNKAPYGGGAIFNYGGDLNVVNSTFIGNSAGYGGGAIYHIGIVCTVVNSTFIDNTVNGAKGGGAICNDGGCTVVNSTFTGNTANKSGGAIFNNGHVTVVNSTFAGNRASSGGAISIIKSDNYYVTNTCTVTNSIFTGNNATDGGAIQNNDELTVLNTTFTGNNATDGGAIINLGTLTVTGSTFTGNNATNYGGAIYNYGDFNSRIVHFNWIVGNTASTGSAIYSFGTMDAKFNWWGSNVDPSGYVFATTGISVDVSPWLVLNVTAIPSNIICGSNSTVHADLQHDSTGTLHDPANGHVPDGIPVTFSLVNGPYGSLTSPFTVSTINGTASTVFMASLDGVQNVNATVDNQNLTASISITPNGHVNVTQSVDSYSPNFWDLVTFTITAHNEGPNNVEGLQITDLLPSGLTLVSADTHGSGTFNSGVWDIGTLENNRTATLTLVANVTSTGDFINWANVTAQTTYDSQQFSSTNVTLNVPKASVITMSKEFWENVDYVHVINSASYQDFIWSIIKVHNKGPDDASNVLIQDILPAGLVPDYNSIWISADGAHWSLSSDYSGNIWNITNLANGAEYWLAIWTQVNRTGRIDNVANVTSQGTYHPGPLASAAAYLDVPDAAHVILSQVVMPSTKTNYWQLVTFHITAHDNGPNNAEGVQVKDLLPAGLTYVSSTPSGTTTYNPTSGIWDVGTLIYGGADATLDIVVNVTSTGIFSNFANVTAQTTYDNQQFSSTNVTLNVPSAANLYVKITSTKSNPEVGETFMLTYKLGNSGPDAANNVTITIPVPENFEISSITGDGNWTYNETTRTITWALMNVPKGDPYLYVTGKTTGAGVYSFGSSIASDTYNINTEGVTPTTINTASNTNTNSTTDNTASVNAASDTVPMQKTGVPINYLILAVLALISGFVMPRRK